MNKTIWQLRGLKRLEDVLRGYLLEVDQMATGNADVTRLTKLLTACGARQREKTLTSKFKNTVDIVELITRLSGIANETSD